MYYVLLCFEKNVEKNCGCTKIISKAIFSDVERSLNGNRDCNAGLYCDCFRFEY